MRDFGIDTIWLTAPVTSLEIEPENALETDVKVKPATGEITTVRPLYRTLDGQNVSGKLATLESENFQFSIAPGKSRGDFVTEPFAKLQMSAAAFSEHGDNLSLHSSETLYEAMQRAEMELNAGGIGWDLANARLSKVAITRQFEVSEPIPHFMPSLLACGVSRRATKKDFGDTGVTIGNGQRTQTGYAKREEMREHGKAFERCPERLLRMEATLLNGTSVKAALEGAATLPDLLKSFPSLPKAFRKEWEREAFKPMNEPMERPCFDWDLILDEAAAASRPKTVLANIWALAIVEQMGLRRAQTMITEKWPGRDNKDKRGALLRDLIAANMQLEMCKVSPSGSPFRSLFLELREKTLAPIEKD